MVLEYARIYKLNSTNGLVYYGSTTQKHLSNRLSCHKTKAKNNSDQYTSHLLFADGAEVVITLVENVENCKDKYELQARERWHIQNNQCVNKNVPNRTQQEWAEANKEEMKEYYKKYYEQNKERIAEQKKEYNQDNKEHLAQQKKEWKEANKEYYEKQQKEYREGRKEEVAARASEKITCECGAVVRLGDISTHRKSQKHINKMLELNNNNGNVQAAIKQETQAI